MSFSQFKKSTRPIGQRAFFFFAFISAALSACDPPMNEGPWPPRAPMEPTSDFTPKELKFSQTGLIFADGSFMPLPAMFKFASDGWVDVYEDASKQPDEYGQHAGMAMTAKGQDFILESNIFKLPVRQDKFLDTEFVVAAYNVEKTFIRLRPGTEDRFGFLELIIDDENGSHRELDFASMMPGARAHVGDVVYELRTDGWYLGDDKIGTVVAR